MSISLLLGMILNPGPMELCVIFFMMLSWAVPIWGIIDAAQRPDWQWQATGMNRTTWIVLMAAFAFVCAPVGLVISVYYLAAIRPRLDAGRAKSSQGTVDQDF